MIKMLCFRNVLLFLLVIAATTNSYAQTDVSRAEKYYIRAMASYRAGNPDKAIEQMSQALSYNRQLSIGYVEMGRWFYELRRYEEAMNLYHQAAQFVHNGKELFALPMCKTAIAMYKYQDALNLISRYGTNSATWKQLKQTAEFQQKHYRPQQKHDSIVLLSTRINTQHGESFAIISADQQQLLYTSSIKGLNDAIFSAQWDSCTHDWFSGRPIEYPINTPLQNNTATISADQHYLFFTRCDNKSSSGWDDGGCDLVMAYRSDSIWSVPQSFGGTINSTGFEGMPCLSPDNKALFFSSDRAGGFGGKDIWMAMFKNGRWQKPINLGPSINTAGDETAPFLSPDNTTLFFASNGWPGFGETDIFRARRWNDSSFHLLENMGYPYNSSANEISFSSSADGMYGWLSSDRDGIRGDYNIYKAKLNERVQPDAVTYISGFTYDSISKELLNLANVELINARSGKIEMQFQTNRGDGSFMISIPLFDQYILRSDKRGYQDRLDTLLLTEKFLATPYALPLSLLPDDYEPPTFQLPAGTIHFEKNMVHLNKAMQTTLIQLQSLYQEKKGIAIQINSYTDNTGTPMLNEEISTQRAQLVKDFLVQNGWEENIIQAYGWGEAEPLMPNDNEDNRRINRRVELIIITH